MAHDLLDHIPHQHYSILLHFIAIQNNRNLHEPWEQNRGAVGGQNKKATHIQCSFPGCDGNFLPYQWIYPRRLLIVEHLANETIWLVQLSFLDYFFFHVCGHDDLYYGHTLPYVKAFPWLWSHLRILDGDIHHSEHVQLLLLYHLLEFSSAGGAGGDKWLRLYMWQIHEICLCGRRAVHLFLVACWNVCSDFCAHQSNGGGASAGDTARQRGADRPEHFQLDAGLFIWGCWDPLAKSLGGIDGEAVGRRPITGLFTVRKHRE